MTTSLIRTFWWQPFSTRPDPIVGLRCVYSQRLVELLKAELRALAPQCVNPARGIRHAGGWLSHYRAWFVETAAWPDLAAALAGAGYAIAPEPDPRALAAAGYPVCDPPDDAVDDFLLQAAALFEAAAIEPVAPDPPNAPCAHCRAPLTAYWVVVRYAGRDDPAGIQVTCCSTACLRGYLDRNDALLAALAPQPPPSGPPLTPAG